MVASLYAILANDTVTKPGCQGKPVKPWKKLGLRYSRRLSEHEVHMVYTVAQEASRFWSCISNSFV